MIIVFFNKIVMLYELFVEIYYIRKGIMIVLGLFWVWVIVFWLEVINWNECILFFNIIDYLWIRIEYLLRSN